jgi:hypothetical protein
MPTTEAGLWKSIERELGIGLPAPVRQFCRAQGWVRDYLTGTDDDRVETRDYIAETIRNLRESGLWQGSEPEPIELTPAHDARWPLLKDLADAPRAAHGLPESDWAPIQVQPVYIVHTDRRTAPGIPSHQVLHIQVDPRVNYRRLTAELRRLWPELVRRGWVRRTRSLEDRSIALLRFVCLETPAESSWRDRMHRWNTRYPGWAYTDARPFQSAFRRAEQQLTGEPYGLEWFYNPVVRLPDAEARQLARQGDRAARAVFRRRSKKMREAIQAARASGFLDPPTGEDIDDE